MLIKFKSAAALSAVILLSTLSGCADAQQRSTPANKGEIEIIVKEYLLENPEIIRDALIILKEKEERQSIVAVQDELRNDKRDYSIGPKNAKVTVVEFYDYNCSFCKRSTGWIQDVMKEHPNDVRIIFKELPILDRRTGTSRNAAKAALAAGKQGKYNEMHFALMAASDLSDKFITSTAIKLGLNMKKFKADMQSDAFDEHLEDTMILATQIPALTGTPFFIINEKFVPSGDTVALQNMLDEALAE